MTFSIDFLNEHNIELPLDQEEFESILNVVLHNLAISCPCTVSLSIVDENEIEDLNAQWRGIQKPTDVLSFECEHPSEYRAEINVPCQLGDVVLAPTYIQVQSKEFNTSFADEIRLLFIHGILHLLGYDHETKEDAQGMAKLELDLLKSIKTDNTITEHTLIIHHEMDLL